MTNFQSQDFSKILEQTEVGLRGRITKLSVSITDLGVYAQTETKKLQQQIDFHEKYIDQLVGENIQLNNVLDTINNRIESLEEVLETKLEDKKKPKKSWLSRFIRKV